MTSFYLSKAGGIIFFFLYYILLNQVNARGVYGQKGNSLRAHE